MLFCEGVSGLFVEVIKKRLQVHSRHMQKLERMAVTASANTHKPHKTRRLDLKTPEVQESGRGWGYLRTLGCVRVKNHRGPFRLSWAGLGGAEGGLPGAPSPLPLSPLCSVPEAQARLGLLVRGLEP